MRWLELDKKNSRNILNSLEKEFQIFCDESMRELRRDLIISFNSVMNEIGITDEQIKNNAYQIDYLYSIKIFSIFKEKYHMNLRNASNNGIWSYISICVIPDIVAKRWTIDNHDRFWRRPNRVWLKTLWWYCYLSWQGDESTTKEIMKSNSTDEILQLIDRTGSQGYRVNLCREIMRQYYYIEDKKSSEHIFRKILKLNTMRVQVIEPSLVKGGIEQYVNDLFNYFE